MGWPATFAIDGLEDDPSLGGVPPQASEGSLYGLLGRAAAQALRSRLTGAVERAAARCEAIILEELTAAGVRFARDHPGTPRAERVVTA